MPKRTSTKIRRPMKSEAERLVERVRAIGVPEEQIRRGQLQEASIVDLSGEFGEGKNRRFKVLLNRGGTAVDRWMTSDHAGIFGESEQRAIRYTQGLWARASNLSARDLSADVVDCVDGMSQQEALTELARLKDRVPGRYWTVYENVCRFDVDASGAGADLASNARSAIDACKTTVAFTASLIAQWRRL